MSVPEATMNKHDHTKTRQNNVRSSRQFFRLESVPEACGKELSAHVLLG
jgi:hypothetical protein